MTLEILIPVLMGCAILWFIGQGLSVRAKIITMIVTLVIVLLIVWFERST